MKVKKVSIIVCTVISFILSMCCVCNTQAESLTTEEIKLYASHPAKALKAKECANDATEATEKNYKECVRWQGNGDAYRYAYWSAIMFLRVMED